MHSYIMKRHGLFAAIMLAALFSVSCNSNDTEVLAVRLDKTKIELVKGESVQLNASVIPAQDVEFTWSSQDEQYVTVDQNGLVTAVGLKKESEDSDEVSPVSVYVKYLNGADECKVTVLPLAPSRVEITGGDKTVNVEPAGTVQLEAKCYPEDADLTDLTWTTNYAAIATVDSKTGLVTGVSAGFAVIRASYNDMIYDEVNVNVIAVDPQSVTVAPAELSMNVGEKKRLKVELVPANASGKPIWTSDDMQVASVDSETGVVTAKASGNANIKVQVGKLSATCAVTVR